jgi:rhodanese-related sulfurtransferase
MGPLVPELIGNELNFIVALVVGIAFGFVLEQAGFSTSKKLVGLFYGYDFTVLRVFFTGGVTAMLGVIALEHFGLLDLKLVYVNPTFLWSAIVGGIIMGLGFVTGGYCPGTSVCAAAIGKIDAMIFIGGSFLGVLIFAEGYPLFEGLYKAASWGNVQIFETLGISQALFAFLLTFMAVAAFWITTLIEKRVNGKSGKKFHISRPYLGLTGLAIILGLTAFVLPDKKEYMLNELTDNNFVASFKIEGMTSDELAFRIIDNDKDLHIVDLRSQKDYDSLGLPGSTHFQLENLFEKDANKLLSIRHKKNVFIANDELTAKKGAILASELGYSNILVLQGGFNQFKKDILEFVLPRGTINRKDIDTFRFRTKANQVMSVLIKENKLKHASGEKKQVKRVLGGC